uniref:Transcription elongation factor 1 homolog n=1 Tax=Sparus aurata TaxID=8175 RepID=A0A671U4H6_SPAAU
MGRRKSKRKPPPKKKMTGDLDSQFTCPFCNHEKSCDVKMERSRNTGIISCTVCLEEFQTPITCILTQNNNYATVLNSDGVCPGLPSSSAKGVCSLVGPYDFRDHGIADGIAELAD